MSIAVGIDRKQRWPQIKKGSKNLTKPVNNLTKVRTLFFSAYLEMKPFSSLKANIHSQIFNILAVWFRVSLLN